MEQPQPKNESKKYKKQNTLQKTQKTSKVQQEPVNMNDKSKSVSEKEQRRLEWAKKLELQKKEKDEGTNISKAELKVKRREQQEAQRLLKQQTAKPVAQEAVKEEIKVNNTQEIVKPKTKKEVKPKRGNGVHKLPYIQHLYREISIERLLAMQADIHPVFVKLGAQYASKVIIGSNARCLALLAALKVLITDLQNHPKKEFCRHLQSVLEMSGNYLDACRPLSVSMKNVLRFIKIQLTQIDAGKTDREKKVRLHEIIDNYINDDIKKAGDAISIRARDKINDGDVIVTYGCSSLIRKILLEAHRDGKRFEIIIVDGRPLMEGKELMRRLLGAGIKCSYCLISSLSCVIRKASKVMVGAHALLTNGYVMSRIGTGQVMLLANAHLKPVLVCCETYKFSDIAVIGPFTYNEINNPKDLRYTHLNKHTALTKRKETSKLGFLSLLYDFAPSHFVTTVVTEIAFLPSAGVPFIMRINSNDYF